MKPLPLLIIISLILIVTIVSAEEIKPVDADGSKSIGTRPMKLPIEYKTIDKSDNLFISILQSFHILKDDTPRVSVTYNDQLLAILPENSRFLDIQVHDACLEYQYGTVLWQDCEEPLQ